MIKMREAGFVFSDFQKRSALEAAIAFFRYCIPCVDRFSVIICKKCHLYRLLRREKKKIHHRDTEDTEIGKRDRKKEERERGESAEGEVDPPAPSLPRSGAPREGQSRCDTTSFTRGKTFS